MEIDLFSTWNAKLNYNTHVPSCYMHCTPYEPGNQFNSLSCCQWPQEKKMEPWVICNKVQQTLLTSKSLMLI